VRTGRCCLVLVMLLAAVGSLAGARELVFVLDASNSMNIPVEQQTTRFELAQRALQEVIEELDEEVPFGIVVFGHRLPRRPIDESCEDIELLVPFDRHSPAQRDSIERRIGQLHAQGMTPLADSIEFAAELNPEARIVVLTDGEETCDGDPQAVARMMAARGQTLDIVAVDVSPRIQDFLAHLVNLTGGQFVSVEDPAKLPEEFRRVAIAPPPEPPEIPEKLRRYDVDPHIVALLLEHLPYDDCDSMWDVILGFLEKYPPDNVVVGTEQGDALFGTPGNDLILGVAGDNRISGFAGNDLLIGGPGDDIIQGGSGNNLIIGGAGDDLLVGGPGCDVIYGEAGNNRIETGEGTNWVYGGTGNDTILGGTGCNYIDPGPGDNHVVDRGTRASCADVTAAPTTTVPHKRYCDPEPVDPCERTRPSDCTIVRDVQTVKAGESVPLSARVFDPDGDPVEITWSATKGFFSDPHAKKTTYYAPPHTTCQGEKVEITVTAVDPCGAASTDTIVLHVVRKPRPPVVDAGPDRTVKEGERITINAQAHHPYCDEMTFTWTSECGRGTFVDRHVLKPVFIAPTTPPCTDEKIVLTLRAETNAAWWPKTA